MCLFDRYRFVVACPPMTPKQRQRIIVKHRDSWTRHGYSSQALYWSHRNIQELRFEVLAQIGIAATESVLDVGCGFADFKRWFERRGQSLDYTGIDLSPDLLRKAMQLHPDATLLEGDLFDLSPDNDRFDWVILSGALNENLEDEGNYTYRVIARMFELCQKGIAFNLLDARFIQAYDLQSHQPREILKYCHSLCTNCELHDSYLQNDFTVYLHKESD